jgi:hypothetical protein
VGISRKGAAPPAETKGNEQEQTEKTEAESSGLDEGSAAQTRKTL